MRQANPSLTFGEQNEERIGTELLKKLWCSPGGQVDLAGIWQTRCGTTFESRVRHG